VTLAGVSAVMLNERRLVQMILLDSGARVARTKFAHVQAYAYARNGYFCLTSGFKLSDG
jgi:hypothetical protein